MQLCSKKSRHLEIIIHNLQTCNEQQTKSNYPSTTQKTILWTKIKKQTLTQNQCKPYPCLHVIAQIFGPCNTFLNGTLSNFYRCITQTNTHIVICNSILTHLWKCMVKTWSIKRLQQPQVTIKYNKIQSTCTYLQVRTFIIYIGKFFSIITRLSNSYQLQFWSHSYAAYVTNFIEANSDMLCFPIVRDKVHNHNKNVMQSFQHP